MHGMLPQDVVGLDGYSPRCIEAPSSRLASAARSTSVSEDRTPSGPHPPPRRSLAFTGSCGPTYAFLDLVAEVAIHAFYSHPPVRADLIIAAPAEIRSDEVLLLKALERVVHRVVR